MHSTTRKTRLAVVTLSTQGSPSELLDLADDLTKVKLLAWALVAAIDGLGMDDPLVKGVAQLADVHVHGIEELAQRLDRLRGH